jgi:hypothetical protein
VGKHTRKHFDMATKSKWNPTPKIKPGDIFSTAVSALPVLAKDKQGKTVVGFPTISVTGLAREVDALVKADMEKDPCNLNRVQAEVESMKEDASELPLEKGEQFVRSFLASVKKRFHMLIRHIRDLSAKSAELAMECEAIRAVAEKTDNDLWDIRMEFDGLNNKMDSIIAVFEGWGVPLDTFNSKDFPPEMESEDGQKDVSGDFVAGEYVAKIVAREMRAQKVEAHNAKLSAGAAAAEALKNGKQMELVTTSKSGAIIKTTATDTKEDKREWPTYEAKITPTKPAAPLPTPTDARPTDKTNSQKSRFSTYTGTSHYCDLCKFAETTGGVRGTKCKNSASRFYQLINYGLVQCGFYQYMPYEAEAKLIDIHGWDFSDEKAVSH